MDEDEIDDLVDRRIDDRAHDFWGDGSLWSWRTALCCLAVICIIGFGFC